MRMRQHAPDPETRNAIKAAARRLFADRGVDGVSIREIVALAGQRNGGSVHYHFGSKEALVRELIVDGARLIDDQRNALLDAIDARGGPRSLREIVQVLVSPAVGLAEDSYLRFINALQMNHRKMFIAALGNEWNLGYLRCLAHIRALLAHIPPSVLNQRLVFMGIYLTTTMAAREAALDMVEGEHPFWRLPYTIDNFVDSLENLLVGQVSIETAKKLDVPQGVNRGGGLRKPPRTRKPTAC